MRFAQEPGLARVRFDEYALIMQLGRKGIIELIVRIDPFAIISRRLLGKEQAHQCRMSRKAMNDAAIGQYAAKALSLIHI